MIQEGQEPEIDIKIEGFIAVINGQSIFNLLYLISLNCKNEGPPDSTTYTGFLSNFDSDAANWSGLPRRITQSKRSRSGDPR